MEWARVIVTVLEQRADVLLVVVVEADERVAVLRAGIIMPSEYARRSGTRDDRGHDVREEAEGENDKHFVGYYFRIGDG